MAVDLARLGLKVGKVYKMRNLLNDEEITVSDSVTIELAGAEPKIFKLF
jgi:hypothetical protein